MTRVSSVPAELILAGSRYVGVLEVAISGLGQVVVNCLTPVPPLPSLQVSHQEHLPHLDRLLLLLVYLLWSPGVPRMPRVF